MLTTIRRRAAAVGVTVLLAAAVAGCSSDESEEYSEQSVDVLYNSAMDLLLEQRFRLAAKQFDEVDRQHPYSIWAAKAQLMSAYANYRDLDYDAAIVGLDRYIQLHPSSRDIAYAYYLRGLAYYDQVRDVKRDQSYTFRAREAFQELVRRYPNSQYARDGDNKLAAIDDHLAGAEMDRGRFYQRRGETLAAIKRYRTVVDRYDTTRHVPEALHRLAEAYTELGLVQEAKATAAVLGYNYPASEWYIDSYTLLTGEDVDRPASADNRSFVTRTWDWLF